MAAVNHSAPNSVEEPESAFPATTKRAVGTVNGVETAVTTISFGNTILVTISQNGRVSHWVHVPLENTNPVTDGYHPLPHNADSDSLLPMTNLTATSLLGGRAPGHETIGQLYARQIASAILSKTPNERRPLVVGLGLSSAEADRDVFFAVVDLVLRCL
ncbi:hypothetical protein PHISP_06324 [Aspergillus sp. HF37]|nr:hypothetical protein PHISP_06324 [Aspergillus sp. HF37]